MTLFGVNTAENKINYVTSRKLASQLSTQFRLVPYAERSALFQLAAGKNLQKEQAQHEDTSIGSDL